MPDDLQSPFATRVEQACAARGIGERAWSRNAGLSEGYLATQRSRAAADEAYVLPERAAMRLAAAVNVNIEWLRFGRGPMAPDDVADDETVVVPRVDPRQEAVRDLMDIGTRLHTAGDQKGLQIILATISELIGSQKEAEAEEPRTESNVRRRAGG